MSHIALVLPTLDRVGGAERQMMLLARGLSRRGWRISAVALAGSGSTVREELEKWGVSFVSLEMRKGLLDVRGWVRFHRWLIRVRPDVVHSHLPHATWLARWSRPAAPVRVLVDTVHTSSVGSAGRRLGYRLSDGCSNCVTAVSRGVSDAYLRGQMVSATHIKLVPNGVDVQFWRPDAAARNSMRKGLGLTDEFLWFAAGRLDSIKDYPALLWAMLGVPAPVRLAIAGAGPDEAALRRLSREYGLESRVKFLGFEPDVRSWMQAADSFVLSSRWEGLPMTLLEAGACELPAVATDVAGSQEVLVHEETGFLAAAGSSSALRSAMTRMMRLSPEERTAMGARARIRVIERFSLDTVLDRWEALYRELLAAHPALSRRGS